MLDKGILKLEELATDQQYEIISQKLITLAERFDDLSADKR